MLPPHVQGFQTFHHVIVRIRCRDEAILNQVCRVADKPVSTIINFLAGAPCAPTAS